MHYIEFPKLGIHLNISPEAIPNLFRTGISIHWYGIIIAAAIMVALTLAMRQSKKYNINEDDLIDMFLIALPVSIIFARLFFVVFTWGNYKNDLLGIFRIWEGGLAIYGAIIGAILSVYLYSRKKKIDMLHLCDFACVYLPLAQAIGRWGNFANQELYGTVTKLPWGMTGSIIGDEPVHPTFLYESLLNLVVFTVLLKLRKNKKVKGSVLAVYLMLYSFVRFMMEFLRTDKFDVDVAGIGNIRYNQVFAVLVLIGAFAWLIYLTKRSREAQFELGGEDGEPIGDTDIIIQEKQDTDQIEAEEQVSYEKTEEENKENSEADSLPE
ncbi:MAG: prolipoprotein diacylglyceryl transferase [Acetivibrionales bacterium]|jgi:phosphatidylglycerol:prolipoprotein diacylglycerol transferase